MQFPLGFHAPPQEIDMACKQLPVDPVLAQWLPNFPPQKLSDSLEDVITPNVQHEERTFRGPDGNEIIMSIFSRKRPSEDAGTTALKRPAMYQMHGGGYVLGTRFLIPSWSIQMVERLDVVCMSIEYRLAPAHPYPAAVDDCYAGLSWIVEHAEEFGIDPERIILGGESAGGGLTAAMTLLARDRGGPRIMGQIVSMPQLDDRGDTFSTHQQATGGTLDSMMALHFLGAYLGERRGTEAVSIYASPARASDLSGLPPAYVDVGSAEIFRDEAVDYAQKLWRNGVPCELHVWEGGFHAFDFYCPWAPLSITANESKLLWVERLLKSKESSVKE